MKVTKVKLARKHYKHNLIKLAGTVLLCQGVGLLSAGVSRPNDSPWYQLLVKPVFNPPNWLFGPVWTILYLLMALSLFRAIIKRARLKWFFIQLVLNFLWSYLFFNLHEIGLALLEIAVLLGAIVATIIDFKKRDLLAAKLLIPYAAWVAFALILNLSIWLLN